MSLDTPNAAQIVWSSLVKKTVADLAWIEQAANSLDNPDRYHKKVAQIQALDTVFFQYGR